MDLNPGMMNFDDFDFFFFLQGKTPRSHGSEKRPTCSTRSQLELEMDADKGKQRQYSQRMAEPRFNNPYFWPPPPAMPSQLDNLVLINKIKEQLMAEKIRPPHLPPTSVASQQPLLVPPSPAESSQSIMSLPKLQQVPGLHPQAVPQPDVALHARPATSTVTGLGLASRAPAVSTSESSPGTGTTTPSTPTSTSQSRLIASSPTLISGITSPPLLDSIKTIQGHGLLGAPKAERGRKKIKAENPSGPPVLVVPYPILASGETAKEGKTYSRRCRSTPSHTQRPSPTSAPTAPSPSPTPPTWPSTCASTWASNPTTAPTARSPSASCPTSSSTPESTPATDPTSARTLAARRPSPSSPTSSPTSASTTRTSPTSAPTATGRTRTRPRCRSTCLHTPSSTPRPIAAACVAVPTPRRPI
ncbi:zinc finger protein 362 isoform X2 [Corvus moneduloides]|uniref:zinc finger protein 362 isoform X2 n=1 Tax=Corvus moneduloides TaxID=1196302 RepID=UPI00136467CE|nr:zinc finger protein 362 isoform X2 [Corvus moneduloides]